MVDVRDLVQFWYNTGKIRKFNDRITDIQICCPKPHIKFDESKGQMVEHYEKRPSLGVRVEDGVFNCFACGFSGRIETLTAEVMGINVYEAVKFLSKRYDYDEEGGRRLEKETEKVKDYDKQLPKRYEQRVIPDELYAPFVENGCEYFERRGYKKSILAKYQFGYDKRQKRAVFPIRNENKEIVGMIGRDVTDQNESKFLVYNYNNALEIEGWDKGSVVHFSIPQKNDVVFVVESGQDVPWGDQIGMTVYTDIASILGSKMTERQAEILSNYKEVVLALDNDYAGEKGTERALKLLDGRTLLTIAKYPDGRKDLGDCSSEEAWKMFQERQSSLDQLVAELRPMEN